MDSKEITREEYKDGFEFLDTLREIGSVNMFGARPHLLEHMGWSRRDARGQILLSKWMDTFDGESSVDARIATLKNGN